MSQSFIDRSQQQISENNQSETSQKKIDPVAQAKWMNSLDPTSGWGIGSDQSVQMFASEEEEQVQKKSNDEEIQKKSSSDVEPEKKGSSGTQTEMPDGVKSKMESSFGVDFSGVNIHQNSDQASNIGALAYAQGNDVHFAPGQYNPGSQKGQELLGHELAHVVQQRQGRVKPTKQGKGMPINDNPALEKEADEMGAKAAQGKMADVAGKGSGVQRQEDPESNVTAPKDQIEYTAVGGLSIFLPKDADVKYFSSDNMTINDGNTIVKNQTHPQSTGEVRSFTIGEKKFTAYFDNNGDFTGYKTGSGSNAEVYQTQFVYNEKTYTANSLQTLYGRDDNLNYTGAFSEIYEFSNNDLIKVLANAVHYCYHVRNSDPLEATVKSESVGGGLDYKLFLHTMFDVSKHSLYNYNGKVYNANEMGNLVWAAALTVMGVVMDPKIWAQTGSRLAGRNDEAWEQRAIQAGIDAVYSNDYGLHNKEYMKKRDKYIEWYDENGRDW